MGLSHLEPRLHKSPGGSPGRHESAAPLPGSMKARNAEETQNNNTEWYRDRQQPVQQQQLPDATLGYQKMTGQPHWQHYGIGPPGTFAEQSEVPFASMAQATYHSGTGECISQEIARV